MDISVSRLNKRMALQLPAELPLGLVFVVGKVRNLTNADGEGGLPYFYLAENDHMLRCHLSERVLVETKINEGDMIRAGGHLAFDIMQANYFLLARDVEVLPEHRPSRTTLAPILADIKKRSDAASLVPADLPDWVQQIAPPELQETAESTSDLAEIKFEQAKAELESDQETDLGWEELAETEIIPVTWPKDSSDLPEGLTDDLVAFLSEAMDSPEDVELTQEMVADLAPAIQPAGPTARPMSPTQNGKAAAIPTQPEEARIPWVVVVVVLFFLIVFLGLILLLALFATGSI